jgi:hypothetical protein
MFFRYFSQGFFRPHVPLNIVRKLPELTNRWQAITISKKENGRLCETTEKWQLFVHMQVQLVQLARHCWFSLTRPTLM